MAENTETLSKQENPNSSDDAKEARVGDEEYRIQKPDVVRFPRSQLTVPPPVAVENEEPGKTSNPIILWQVYALGGFLVVRWIWARWNERKAQNGPSNDNQSDDQPSTE